MVQAVEIILTITPGSVIGSEHWEGQGLRATMEVRDVLSGAPVAAGGVRMLVRPPVSTVPTVYMADQLTPDGVGRWLLDTVADAPGAWRARAECTAPHWAARDGRIVVRRSGVIQPDPPDVLLVDPDGAVLTTPDGAAYTARRIDRLAAAGAIAGNELLVVMRGGVALTGTMDGLLAAAEGRADAVVDGKAPLAGADFTGPITVLSPSGVAPAGRVVPIGYLRGRAPINLLDYAVCDGVADDTDGFAAAVAEAIATRRPLEMQGRTARLVPKPAILHTYGNTEPSGNPLAVHAAARLLGSGLKLRNGRIVYGKASGLQPISTTYFLATDKNSTVGTIKDTLFENIEFDVFKQDVGHPDRYTHINPRTVYMVGFEGLEFRGCLFRSSTTRDSGTVSIQNGRGARFEGGEWRNVTQAVNASYVDDLVIPYAPIFHVKEAVDLDRGCTRVRMRLDGVGRPGDQGSQLVDANSVQIADLDLTSRGYYNTLNIGDKPTTWPTWAEYITKNGVTDHPPEGITSRDITVTRLHCENGGGAGGSVPVVVGVARGIYHANLGAPANITFDRTVLRNCAGGFIINEGEVELRGTLAETIDAGADTTSSAAIYATSCIDPAIPAEARNRSRLDLTLDGVTVLGSTRMAVVVVAPNNLRVPKLEVAGYNSAGGANTAHGFWARELGYRSGRVSLGDIAISGGVGPGGAGDPRSVRFDEGVGGVAGAITTGVFRLDPVPNPIHFAGGNPHRAVRPLRQVPIGSVVTISGAVVCLLPLSGQARSRVAWVGLLFPDAVAITANTTLSFTLHRRSGALTPIASTRAYTNETIPAGTVVDLGMTESEVDAVIDAAAGVVLSVSVNRVGTAITLPNIVALVAEIAIAT